MIEAPEAKYLSEQLNSTIKGKVITDVIVKHTPHKFAFFHGNPDEYVELLMGKKVGNSRSVGGMVEITLDEVKLAFTDGANLRYYYPGEKLPAKHQLLIGFEDQSCLIVSIRMYGGILGFRPGHHEGGMFPYYNVACEKPQVMSDAFSKDYFLGMINEESAQKKSAKAFLATEQTIPGLGNGVLQDILYNARIHPKTKVSTLTNEQKENLFCCVINTMQEMYDLKGRNTETDLFGRNGEYIPFLSKDTAGKECPRCGGTIKKESYLGGSIYYCDECQVME